MAMKLRKGVLMILILILIFSAPLPVQATKTSATDGCSPQTEQYVWEYFMELTENPQAAAGIVGNLYFESHLLPDNLETFGHMTGCDKKYTYTQATDLGIYKRFTSDGFGYGLAQWTIPARKQKLLDLAKLMKRSVGALDVQLKMVALELEEYNMLSRLQSAESVRFASDYVMVHFENPRDQSEARKAERAQVCQEFYDYYYLLPETEGIPAEGLSKMQRKVISVATHADKFGIDARAGYCQAWANDVYRAAGLPNDSSNSAAMSANRYSISDDFSVIPVGAAVYGHSTSEFGHVGIYVGNGKVYHNVGGIAVDDLEKWIREYDGYCWGWIGGTDLVSYGEDHE